MAGGKGATVFFLVLAAASVVVLLPGQGSRDLWSPDEPRVAGIAADMSRTHDWVVPRLNGDPFLEKPPLFFWSAAAALDVLGETEFAARLPSVATALLGVLFFFFLTRRMGLSPQASFLSSLVLLTAAEYWELGRRGIIDMMLCFFITCAMITYYLADQRKAGRGFWSILFILSLAGAVLAKALVGLILPLSALCVWILLAKGFSLRAYGFLFGACLLSLIPAGIWLCFLYDQLGYDALHEVVWNNNFARFTGSHPSHLKPFYYYFAIFPLQFFPWTLFLPLAVVHHYRELKGDRNRKNILYGLSWFALPFLILTLSAGKRGIYAIPLYPAAALLVGMAVDANMGAGKLFRIPSLILAGFLVLVHAAFCGVAIYFKMPVFFCVAVSLPGLVLSAYILYRLIRERGEVRTTFVLMGLVVVLTYGVAGGALQPLFNPFKTFKPLIAQCGESLSKGRAVALFSPTEALEGAAIFYLKEKLPEFFSEEDLQRFFDTREKGLVLMDERMVTKEMGLRTVERFDVGHRTYVLGERTEKEVADEYPE